MSSCTLSLLRPRPPSHFHLHHHIFGRLAQLKVTCDLRYLLQTQPAVTAGRNRKTELHSRGWKRHVSLHTPSLSCSTPPVTLSTYIITVSHLHTLTPASNHTLTPASNHTLTPPMPSYPHFWMVVDDRMTAAMNASSWLWTNNSTKSSPNREGRMLSLAVTAGTFC